MSKSFFISPKRKCCKLTLEMEASTVPNDGDMHACPKCNGLFTYSAEKKKWLQFPPMKFSSSGAAKEGGKL